LRFGSFLGHGMPDLLPPTFFLAAAYLCRSFPCLEPNYSPDHLLISVAILLSV